MRLCHICEQIARADRSIGCLSCRRAICKGCFNSYFGRQLKEPNSLQSITTERCVVCEEKCVCKRCQGRGKSVLLGERAGGMREEWGEGRKLRVEEDMVGEGGFFKGKNIRELPLYLQRLFLKKKVLYSRHEVSLPSSCMIQPEGQESEPVSVER